MSADNGAGRGGLADDEEQMIVAMTEVLRREMNDEASFKVSASRLRNLYFGAGISVGVFVGRIDEARKLTQTYTPLITKEAQANGSGFRKKNKMAYFFEVLEDRLGLRAAETAHSAPRRR